VAIHQFAVYAHFDGATLTEEEAERLTTQRALHLEVISRADPVKISATASAETIHAAIGLLAQQVARVAPDATVTGVNAIEILIDRGPVAAAVSVAS
jgi:hypothetical protein